MLVLNIKAAGKMSPILLHTFYFLLVLQQIGICKCEMYRKCINPNDTDYATLFRPISNPPPKILGSLIECSAYALYALNNPIKSMRASGFYYNGNNCTLGRTPPFDDMVNAKAVILDGSNGVHAVANRKPVSSVVNSDLFIYILLNEEKQFEYTPSVPNSAGYDFNTKVYTATTMQSIVQTLEGQFVAGASGGAYLQYQLNPLSVSAFTFLVWYNKVLSPGATEEPLVGLESSINSATHINFWTSYNNQGDLLLSATGLNQDTATSGNAVPNSAWAYVGITADTSTGNLNFYVNGNLTKPVSSSFTAPVTVDTLYIGYNIDTNSIQYFMKNYLASVEIYLRALSASDVVTAMTKSTTTRVLF